MQPGKISFIVKTLSELLCSLRRVIRGFIFREHCPRQIQSCLPFVFGQSADRKRGYTVSHDVFQIVLFLENHTFHLQIIWLIFHKGRDRVRTEAKAHGGIEVYRFLSRTTGCIQRMSSSLQGFLSGGFKQGSAYSTTAVIPGHVEAINNEPSFV